MDRQPISLQVNTPQTVTTQNNKIIYEGEVIDNNDPFDAGRLKVLIKGLDDFKSDYPWCDALLSKTIHNIPQIGEAVRIILTNTVETNIGRLWVGPVISQFDRLKKSPAKSGAWTTTYLSTETPLGPITKNNKAKEVFPDKTKQAILGRDNSDIIFYENGITIRAGKHLPNNPTERNNTNPSFIDLYLKAESNEVNKSYANIYAEEINLISPKGNPLIPPTKEELEKLLKELHPAVYGDNLVNLLRLVVKAILEHVHSFSTNSPDISGSVEELAQFPLNSILSTKIKLN